jgi:hypothetical protein
MPEKKAMNSSAVNDILEALLQETRDDWRWSPWQELSLRVRARSYTGVGNQFSSHVRQQQQTGSSPVKSTSRNKAVGEFLIL